MNKAEGKNSIFSDIKKRIQDNKRLVKTSLICVAIVVLLIVLLLSPLCGIRKIETTPMEHYTQEDLAVFLEDIMHQNGFLAVAEQTSLHQSASIFSMRLSESEEKMLFELPYLENVEIRYAFPDKVKISVTERKASFLLEHYGIYLLVDTHGVVLETFTQEDCPDMPVVKGVEFETYKVGVSIRQTQDAHIDTAIGLCNMMQQLSMSSYIDIIDVTDYNNIKLYCAPSLTILFGSGTNVGMRLTELKGILDSNLNGNSNGVLDMRSGGHTIFTKNETVEE